MADTQAQLRAALAEAVEESEFPTDEKAEADSWNEWESEGGAPAPESASAADGDTPSKDELVSDEAPAEDADSDQPEVPSEYWGVSLEGVPDERAREIIAHFEQQDSTIQKLQARLAKEPDAPAPAVEEGNLEDITDEQLLVAAGYDPEDYEVQNMARFILPGLRRELALEEKVDALVTKDTVREVEQTWNSQLDELESVHGKLPFDRIQVLRYAIDEGLGSPFETYFRISAGPQKEVRDAVAQARREAARKAEGGGVKPRTTSGESPVIDPKTTSLKDAVAIAMRETEKETGLSFKNIFGRKVKVDE